MSHRNKIKVTSSNLEGGVSVIRVYLNKQIIVEEPITKRNPLQYLRTLTRSKHFTSIERQLMKHSLTLSDVGITRSREARKQGGLS